MPFRLRLSSTHYSDTGLGVESILFVLGSVAGLRIRQFALVLPSMRGQFLTYGDRRYDSEGVVSPWDGEVEDALAFLRVAGGLPHVAGEGAAAIGFSAGATTALLAAVREPAIAGVVDFFAPVDFYGPFVKDLFIRILDGDPPDLAKIPYLETQIVDPLRRGELSLAGMRLELLRRSPAYFADRLPPVLAHHGLEDAIVPDGETRRLAEAVGAAGGRIEAHYYAGNGHSPFGLSGSLGRTVAFLERLSAPPSARRTQSPPGPAAAASEVVSRSSWFSAAASVDSQPAKGWPPPMQ